MHEINLIKQSFKEEKYMLVCLKKNKNNYKKQIIIFKISINIKKHHLKRKNYKKLNKILMIIQIGIIYL